MLTTTFNGRRYFTPIGPAPEGWSQIENCSYVIPHTENAEGYPPNKWMDDEMNEDHYSKGES